MSGHISVATAVESRRACESCNSNSDCAGELRCERAMCSATDSAAAAAAFTTPATGGAFRPESLPPLSG